MQTNVGNADKILRIVAGLAILGLYFFLEGNLKYLALIGIVPVATGLLGWCPLYAVIGVDTCPKKKD